ncbi:Bcl-2-like protein 1 [Chionoecetes opilio]|uniref:Bcl-2-like protein 1 n=1 Tax=Chionoecetes opilio TaxID=41210 RepID=A0A8J4XQD4_CHIOP|nr:Bcl-2-like protein 1 [Chionoecetes opilio]
MSPEAKKEPVASKVPSDNETDEGFHSPSTSRSELRCSKEEEATNTRPQPQNSANTAPEKPDNDVIKARRLAEFTVLTVTGRSKSPPQDSVEETLIRCVRSMMEKHEILLRGMMRRLDVRPETGYQAFVGVANELFEGQKRVVTWGRVVALYAFGAQLALHCTEKKEEEFCGRIVDFLGQYASEVLVPFVKQDGGWETSSPKGSPKALLVQRLESHHQELQRLSKDYCIIDKNKISDLGAAEGCSTIT